MFGKVKKWLGIEGVKVELLLPEEVRESDGSIKGRLRFYSMSPQTVTRVHIKLVERYSRGRDEDRLVDEYELGAITLDRSIDIPGGEPVELGFELPFSVSDSKMDEIGNQNFLMGGLVKISKWFSKVNSEFRVEVEAKTLGVALSPFDKKTITIK
ncbi:MAG: sporulation protein [Saprospiraceae bacterium]